MGKNGLWLGERDAVVPRPGSRPRPRPGAIRLDDEDLVRHMLIIGATGSGKTTLFEWLIAQQMARGGGVLFVDAKPTREAVLRFVAMAYAAGRIEDVHLLVPGEPFSDSYNLVERGTASEIAARIQLLYYSKESEYYRVTQHAFILALAQAMRELDLAFHIGDFVAAASDPGALGILYALLERRGVGRGLPALLRKSVEEAGGLHQVSGIGRALARYVAAEFEPVTRVWRGDIVLEDLIEEGGLLYVGLPSMRERETAIQWALALIADLKSTVGRLLARSFRSPVPFLVVCDEAGNYSGGGLTNLVEQARAAGIAMCIAGQSLEQFRTDPKWGDCLQIILQNTGVKVACKMLNPDEAKKLAETFGKRRWVDVHGASVSRYDTLEPSVSVQAQEDYIVRPEIVMDETRVGRAVARIDRPNGRPEVFIFRWPVVRLPREAMEAAEFYISRRWPRRLQPPPEACLGLYETVTGTRPEAVRC